MDGFSIASSATPQARSHTTNVIEDNPQKKHTRALPPTAVAMPPPLSDIAEMEDDFPTPRANATNVSSSLVPSVAPPAGVQDWRSSATSAGTYFEDDLYESPSDNDSEVVPFRISNSIRKYISSSAKLERVPSLVIPSPGLWPTVQKSASANVAAPLLSPKMPLSPAALARLAVSSTLRVPSQSTTPSLDGSLTSEEISNMSCPSTPDLRSKGDEVGDWDRPVQLHPDAMDTLLQISSAFDQIDAEESESSHTATVPPPPQLQMVERGLNISITIPTANATAHEEEFSALSIPSPGGFFASLAGSSSHVWSFPKPESDAPSTSTAETFYGVPWRQQIPQVLERVVEVDEVPYDGPPTARRVTNDGQTDSPLVRQSPLVADEEFDGDYERKLRELASVNMNRTSVWLHAQDSYLSELNDVVGLEQELETPETPASSIVRESTVDPGAVPLSKKAVRFAEDKSELRVSTMNGKGVANDSLFYRAFQHFNNKSNARDAFTHRESRAEALRTQRHYLSRAHRAVLAGSFALAAKPAPMKDSAALRPVPNDEESAKEREIVATAGKEQEALQQISLPCFELEAGRFLNNGALMPRQAAELITTMSQSGQNPRILDLGGQPIASWGWAVATENREAKVYTAVLASMSQNANWTAHRGPSNHRTVAVPNLWTLPFASGSFNVISARTLHSLLRNSKPTRDGGDEYDATLKELHRVLAPGGYVHFLLLDAEVAAPSSSALAAKGIEFAVSLRSRGYDPCAGRRFVARLNKAGFCDVKRSWMSLPYGGPEVEGMNAVTGLYGSLAWEKWMLKFQREMGRPEERQLEGVAKAMDEARAHPDGAAWKMLVGCARKA